MRILINRIVGILLLAATFAITLSCEDTTGNDTIDLQTELEERFQGAQEALNFTMPFLESITMTTSTVASGMGQLNKSQTPSDTLFPGCPVVTWDHINNFLIDYGENGCTGPNGGFHSGQIALNGGIQNAQLIVNANFQNFTARDFTLNGDLSLTATLEEITAQIVNGQVNRGADTTTINANFTVNYDLNGTLGDPHDDSYTVDGTATVVAPNGKTYQLEVLTPLSITGDCSYPVDGVVKISDGIFEATVDFFPNNGECDDIFVIDIGGIKRTIRFADL